jgi:hypothetical protein
MDVHKRYTDTNELKAQGIGNILSSLIGGLPMTSVVVRSSANNSAGAKSKMSAIIHGVLLLISVLAVPVILKNTISISDNINFSGYKLQTGDLYSLLGKRKISIYSLLHFGSCSNN